MAVEYQRTQRRIRVTLRRFNPLHDSFQHLFYAFTGFGGYAEDFFSLSANYLQDFSGNLLGARHRQIDLVHHWNDFEVGFQGQV